MKQTIKKQLAVVLTMILTFITMVSPVSALEITPANNNLYSFLSYEEVSYYINNAETTETYSVENNTINYYYGTYSNEFNYVVVDDPLGYSLVLFNDERSEIIVNGKDLDVNAAPITVNINPENSYSIMENWKYYDTFNTYQASVVGLAISVAIAPIDMPQPYKGAAISYFSSQFATGFFPLDYTLTVQCIRHYDSDSINPDLGTFTFRNQNSLYGGLNGALSRRATQWTTYTTRYL